METTEKEAATRDSGNDDVLAFHFGLFWGWELGFWQENELEGGDYFINCAGNAVDFYKLNLLIWFDN